MTGVLSCTLLVACGSGDQPPTGRDNAKEGEFCGGIAAFQCEEGLRCQFDGTYPDAGGVCVKD